VSDLVRILLEKLLGWTQKNLYRSPSRNWNEIEAIDRFGRLALMAVVLIMVLVPIGWLFFG
jgi:hypothetical protein